MNAVTQPSFAKPTEPRTFTDPVADLGKQHERFVAAIEDFERRVEAWGERIEEKTDV